MWTNDLLHQQILEINLKTEQANHKTTLLWVPSHIGIKGNERADEGAKSAVDSPDSPYLKSRSLSDWKQTITAKVKKRWNVQWEQMPFSHLRLIKAENHPWMPPKNLTPKECSIISRLRIGHTKLTHLHLLLGLHRPTCQTCGNVYINVQHLFQCQRFQRERKKLKIEISELYKENSGIEKTLNYLMLTKLANDI